MRVFFFISIPFIISCNIYAPLTSKGEPEDFIEEALKCSHDGNIGCSIENYSQLPSGNDRSQRLCSAYLAKAGLTLRSFINILKKANVSMLGELSQTLVPWSQEKEDAALLARDSSCNAVLSDTGVLLKGTSLIIHCAMLIAKSEASGNNNGIVSKVDIDSMPDANAIACNSDITGTNSTQLGNAGLTAIASAYDQIPASLRSPSSDAALLRTAIKTTLPAP